MKTLTVAVDVEYDDNTLSALEVLHYVRTSVDIYFNALDFDFDEEVVRILNIYENVAVVSPWDKG
jgi:hypothetical protein